MYNSIEPLQTDLKESDKETIRRLVWTKKVFDSFETEEPFKWLYISRNTSFKISQFLLLEWQSKNEKHLDEWFWFNYKLAKSEVGNNFSLHKLLCGCHPSEDTLIPNSLTTLKKNPDYFFFPKDNNLSLTKIINALKPLTAKEKSLIYNIKTDKFFSHEGHREGFVYEVLQFKERRELCE